jgi:hypothetical protein
LNKKYIKNYNIKYILLESLKNTFILYVFDIIKFYNFSNMLSQTLYSLTLTKPRMQCKKDIGSINLGASS